MNNENTFDVYQYKFKLYSKGVLSEIGQTKMIKEVDGYTSQQVVKALPEDFITELLVYVGTIQGVTRLQSASENKLGKC